MKNYTIAASALVSLLLFIGTAQANTYTVCIGCGISSVQDAINQAVNGDEVVITDSGVYQEEVTIDKDIVLRSLDQSYVPTILSNGQVHTVTISANGVELRGLVIKYNGTEGDTAAVSMNGFGNAVIFNNTIVNDGGGERNIGLELISSSGNNITRNNITHFNGIASSYNRGLTMTDCRNNFVSGNNITVHGQYGSWALGIVDGSDHNSFIDNTISVNGTDADNYGIRLESGLYNTLLGNNVSNIGSVEKSAGILLATISNTRLVSNTIYVQTNGTLNYGVNISDSANMTLEYGQIEMSSAGSQNSGLVMRNVSESRFSRNNIEVSGASETQGLAILSNEDGSNDNVFEYNDVTINASSGYGLVFEDSTGNTIYRSSISAGSATDIGDIGTNGGFENFIIDSQFDKQEVSFEGETDTKIFVQYNVSFLVTDGSSNTLEGVRLTINGSQTADEMNPTDDVVLWTNSTGGAKTLLTEFMANSTYQGGAYLYFTNYTARPSIGLNRTTRVNASSVQTVGVEIEADSISVQTSLSTTNNSLDVDAPSVGASLEIATGGSVSGATVSIANHSQNPAMSGVFGITALGKYLQIEVSDSLSSGLSWAIIRVNYTEAEIAAADVNESSLRIYHFNETSGSWQAYDPPFGGANVSDNFVWANTTHFSTFGVFGSQVLSTSAAPTSGGGGGGGGGAASAQSQQTPAQTPVALPAAPSETEEAIQAPAEQQPGEAAAPVSPTETPSTAPSAPIFSPPSAPAAGNPITGLFAFGQNGSPLTGMVFAADGSPNLVFFLGLVAAALTGSVVYMKRRLIFRRGQDRKYGGEGGEAGVAAADSEGEDSDTPRAREGPGQADGEGGEKQAVRGSREEDRD